MDKFLGTFKRIPDSVTGVEEYAQATKMPKTAVDKIYKGEYTVVISKTGDTYCMVNSNAEGKQHTFTFKLDESFPTTDDGVTSQNLMKMEGDRLVGEHKNDKYELKTVRYFEGDKMIMEASAKGATMKTAYSRA